MVEIRDLEGLLGLKHEDNRRLTYTAKPLLETGENYGSTMLAVDVKVTENGEESERHYVAKMCPPSDVLKQIFNTAVTFKKEMALYTDIVPALQQFQRERGVEEVIDFFSKLEGRRLSLDPTSDQVDDDAAMLFGNLKYEGFRVLDRFKGFDLESAELVMKDLAAFHAVPLAFKVQRPEEFGEKILAHIRKPYGYTLDEGSEKPVLDIVLKIAEEDEECRPYLDNIETAFYLGMEGFKNKADAREPFATITHNDYWVNNTMIKFDKDRPVKNVMVDFQIIEYGSPADDLVFFLYSSVNPDVLKENYDRLVDLYYNTFINTLEQLKCDTDPFSFDLFEDELRKSAGTFQFTHLLFMLKPILAKRGTVKQLSEIRVEDMLENQQVSEEFPERVRYVVIDFAKRGWI